MTDSVGQMIARKLQHEIAKHVRDGYIPSVKSLTAIIDAELEHQNNELYRACNESHEAKQAWGRAIDRADKAVAEFARERDGWVSVKERLPKASGRYWCWWPKYFCGEVYFSSAAQEWWHTGSGGRKFEEAVTHWRELPAPPACGS